jgi:electron transport complex protein RnfG
VGEIIKLTVVLVIISMIAGLATAVANSKTKERIAAQQLYIQRAAVEAVFPDGVEIEEREGGGTLPYKYWSASRDGKIIGYAFKISGQGYAGDIIFMVSSDLDGKILGMTVLEHTETPGLGSKAQAEVSPQFIGKESPFSVVKANAKNSEIQAITGATITTKAIVDIVNSAINLVASD